MELTIRGQTINTMFDLLGTQENDITFGLSWVLSRCSEFARQFLLLIDPAIIPTDMNIIAQGYGAMSSKWTGIME